MSDLDLKKLHEIIHSSVSTTFKESGYETKKKDKPQNVGFKNKSNNVVKEALHVGPKSFLLKTEKLSKATIGSHENLYKKYVDTFNKLSSELDAANKYEAGSFGSLYRSLKIDENYNLNAIKLHELYFSNISDLASEIAIDSLPYIKFSRDFGTFEKWQFDYIACALSSREGWALTVYEPYKNVYMNICVDGHTTGIPLGTIPVLVIDMWSHSYYKDYETDKRSYLIAMMKEINWDVVEARMALAEKSELSALYHIKPIYNDQPEQMMGAAQAMSNTPVDNVVQSQQQSMGNSTTMPASTPAAPTTSAGLQEKKEK